MSIPSIIIGPRRLRDRYSSRGCIIPGHVQLTSDVAGVGPSRSEYVSQDPDEYRSRAYKEGSLSLHAIIRDLTGRRSSVNISALSEKLGPNAASSPAHHPTSNPPNLVHQITSDPPDQVHRPTSDSIFCFRPKMRDFSVILAVISVVGAYPLALLQDDLFGDTSYDTFFDPSPDLYASGLDDPTEPLLLAGTFTSGGGYDPAFDEIPWSNGVGDTSWTGLDRPSGKGNGNFEDVSNDGDGEGQWNRELPPIVTPEGGPTSFELSPEQSAAIVAAGTLVVNGVTYVYNGVSGVISAVGDWIPTPGGL